MDKILFIRLRLLGDIIFTIPTIQLFSQNYPDTRLYYIVEERFNDIAELIPGIHKVITVPCKMGIRELLKFRKKMKKMNFKTAVDFHSGPKSALLTFLSGAKKRIGYKTPNRNWAFTHLTSRVQNNPPLHSVHNQINLLEHIPLPIDKIPCYPDIKITKNNLYPPLLALKPSFKRVVIHVGAGKRFRDWGFENFNNLIKMLAKENIEIFLIGNTEHEISRSNKLAQLHRVTNYSGKLSIKDIFYLISQAAVYFGVDSGPLHIASLTQTPIVAIYGPNLPEISGPYRKKNISILKLNLSCQPCSQKKCIYDKIKCMKNLLADKVYEKIIKYLP